MAWRKWVVRGLVFAAAAALASGVVVYQHWTSPGTVRRLVLDKLSAKFHGATVTLESAHLRLLGGIAVRELRMTRRDDSDNTTFLWAPSAVIYHDKQQLLEGRLVVRKIELERPHLRVWRGRDGRWSVLDVVKPDPHERIPTIVVRHATVVVEDRQAAPGTPPLEIKDVGFTLVNDPETTVTLEAAGASDVGPLRVSGRWQRDSDAVRVTVDAGAVPVGPALVQRLSGLCPEAAGHLRDLTGTAAVDATLTYDPGRSQPFGCDVGLSLTDGRFHHRELPCPLEGLTVALRCTDGRIPKIEARARAGPTTVALTARNVVLPGATANLPDDLDVTVTNLPVTEALFEAPALKKHKREVYDRYQPVGAVDVTVQLRPAGRGPWTKRLLVEPRGLTTTYEKFIYTLDRVGGSIELLAGGPGGEVWHIDLTGHAGDRPIRVKGEVTGAPPAHAVDLHVWGENLPLDGKVQFALDELSKTSATDFGALARSFEPRGQADFHAHARREPNCDKYENRYVVRFHHASARHKHFKYRLDDISGLLDVRPDLSWEFRDFSGRHGDTVFTAHAHCRRHEDGVHVEIHGRNVRLDEDLRAALKPDLQKVWSTFDPSGPIDCDGTVVIPPTPPDREPKPEIDLTVQARGCAVRPAFFRYALRDLHGTVHYARDAVTISNLTARHDGTAVRLDRGLVVLKPGGGFTADLTYLHADGVRADDDFARALRGVRETLARAWAALDVQGALELHTRLYIDAPPGTDPPRVYWDGSVVLRDATLRAGVRVERVSGTVAARGWFNGSHLDGVDGNLDLRTLTVFGQPLEHVRGELLVTEDEPDVLKLPGLMASYLGGQVYGPIRVEFGPRLRYELNLTASQLRLEEFARHNFRGRAEVPEMNGLAVARLYLKGEGAGLDGLRGNGRVDVPNGKMANLPPLVDLLKFLGLRLPDRTAFEEAHAVFDIDGARARVRQLELFGNAISLRGQGDVGLDDGDLNLDFNVDWARLGQVLPPGVRAIPREISNQLLKIEARGRVGALRFHKQPVPLLTDPLRRILSGDHDLPRERGAQGERGASAP